MTQQRAAHTLVFGAGGVGLAFLGPELQRDSTLCFVDIGIKEDLLTRLHERHAYRTNIGGLASEIIDVDGVDGLNLEIPRQAARVPDEVTRADVIFTAVGQGNLPRLAPIIAEGIRARDAGRPLTILCCENGKNIADGFRPVLEQALGGSLPPHVRIGDTVIGRMCRIEEELSGAEWPAPVFEDLGWAAVAEAVYGIPVNAGQLGVRSLPLRSVDVLDADRFNAHDSLKTYAHNGGHALLGYLGHLRGHADYHELAADRSLMSLLRRFLHDEIGPALLATYGDLIGESYYMNYSIALMRRLVCPFFGDVIHRGVRGADRKLAPDERFVSAARFILAAGIEPRVYGAALAAAVLVGRRAGELGGSVDDVLTDVCQLTRDEDRPLREIAVDAFGRLESGDELSL